MGYISRYSRPRVVVAAPTKELCSQILSIFRAISSFAPIRSMGFVGANEGRKKKLKDELDVLVGTPEDICKYANKGWVSYTDLTHLVFDEADTLMDEGFRKLTEKVLSVCKVSERYKERTTDHAPVQC